MPVSVISDGSSSGMAAGWKPMAPAASRLAVKTVVVVVINFMIPNSLPGSLRECEASDATRVRFSFCGSKP